MPRLFRAPAEPPDTRPAILSVVSLMVILLPMLLMTTDARKLAGLPLAVSAPGDQLPPIPPGPIESLQVTVHDGGFLVRASVRSTDVLAGSGDVEVRELAAPDLDGLQAVLRTLKGLDGKRSRITLVPGTQTKAAEVVRWMDAVKLDPKGPLFPEVVLQSPQTPAAATP